MKNRVLMSVKSWQIVGTATKVSGVELDEMLIKHTIEPGTELHHPKHGRVRVRFLPGGNGTGGTYILVNKAGVRL